MKDFTKITKIIFILTKKQGKMGKYLEKQFFLDSIFRKP